jgi:hypothetical protein
VTRVHSTAEDLARTRFSPAPAPLVETVLGLVEMRRGDGTGRRWHGQTWPAFPATARPLLDLIPAAGYWPEFLDPVAADLDQTLEMVRPTPRRAGCLGHRSANSR